MKKIWIIKSKEYNDNFQGKCKLHVNTEVKPVATTPRFVPYHLKERAPKVIKDIIKQDIIQEHSINETAPWVSNAVIASKPDGSIRMTLDAHNVNKVILPMNLPVPRHQDIKAKLAKCKIFSKKDLKSVFWQIELDKTSCYLTAYNTNDRILR